MFDNTTTANTSFANTSFATTVPSQSNGSQKAAANTSFATSVNPSQPTKSAEEFHSSGTFGSLGTDIDWDQAEENAKAAVAEPENLADKLDSSVASDAIPPPSPNIVSPVKSMEHHQVKALPKQGLFVPDIVNEKLKIMPFKYRWEFMRFALEVGVEPADLLPTTHNEDWQEYAAMWDYLLRHDANKECEKQPQRSSEKAWSCTDNNFENITLKASLAFNQKNSGPLFSIQLQPLQVEEASCRFQRAFGGDRFLYLEVPPFKRDGLPSHLKQQLCNIEERFEDWLPYKQKPFLGREWEVVHIEPLASKKQTLRRQQTEVRGFRVILFATRGCDIPRRRGKKIHSSVRQEMSVYDLINWFMPLDRNSDQAYLKAFARISLGLTTTLPGLVFKPSQVKIIDDIKASRQAENTQYDDSSLTWPKDKKKDRVMNDGCAQISVGAAQALWKTLNKEGPLPSTFQGRIGGAKGMWMLSASPDTQEAEDTKIWIEVSKSQLKFKPHPEDEDESDKFYDPHRLTFDLHSTTNTAEPSCVYLLFFPILQDRGVPPDSLKKLFEVHLDREREALLGAIENPVCLRKWVNEQNALGEERNRKGDILFQAGMPLQKQEKIVFLLESGFDMSCDYLQKVTERLVATSLRILRQNVRVPLPRCTYVKGVADPYGVLNPGEIHLQFSKSFVDETSGECLNFLDNRAVLVARNPALRRSDVQKVDATFKIELAHLKDVVVFPSRGRYPFAGKLQGGDYDGDTFWVCWEPELVDPFKNAFPPLEDPVPENYGIRVDRRKLKDMYEGTSIGNFLRASFKFRCKPSLLGQATNLCKRVVYLENDLASPNVDALVDIHDLLVDYTKNGYEFDEQDFEEFKRTCVKLPMYIPKPKHEEAREKDRDEQKRAGRKKATRSTKKAPEYNHENILDRLYFETIDPHTRATLDTLHAHFARTVRIPDPDLEATFLAEQDQGQHDPEIAAELATLTTSLRALRRTWGDKLHGRSHQYALAPSLWDGDDAFDDPDTYNAAVDECFSRYNALAPANAAGSPVIRRWGMDNLVPGAPTYWELLKASALYHVWHNRGKETRPSTFVFHMAGKALCWLKACCSGSARPIVQPMWANMRPRKVKVREVVGGNRREGLREEEEEEEEDMEVYESAEEGRGGGGGGGKEDGDTEEDEL